MPSNQGSIQRFKHAIQSGDLYAQYVQLSINGKKKVSSVIGLLSTFMVATAIIGFGIYKGLILVQKSQYETQLATVLRPINYSNPDIYQINEYGFDFAVRTKYPLEAQYGNLIVEHVSSTQVYNETLGSKVFKTYPTVLNTSLCVGDLFNHTDKEEIEFKDIAAYQCLQNKSWIRMGGSYLADQYEFLRITLKPCVNSSDSETICAPIEEIKSVLLVQSVQIRIVNYYFDKDEIDQPIKSYIDDSIYYGVVEDTFSNNDIKVKISEAKYDSSLMPWAVKEVREFTQIENLYMSRSERISKDSDPYMYIYIRIDFFSNIYQKNIYSFMDYVSQIGGLFNSLYGAGRLIVYLFMESLILSTIMKFLFQYNSKGQEVSDFQRRYEKKIDLQQENSNSIDQQHQEIMHEVLDRRSLDFRPPGLLCRLMRCYSNKPLVERKRKLFQSAKRKLRFEFDVVKLFRMMREFQKLKEIVLGKEGMFLFKFQKEFVLHSDDEYKSDEDFEDNRQTFNLNKTSLSPFALMDKTEYISKRILASLRNNENQNAQVESSSKSKIADLLQGILNKPINQKQNQRSEPHEMVLAQIKRGKQKQKSPPNSDSQIEGQNTSKKMRDEHSSNRLNLDISEQPSSKFRLMKKKSSTKGKKVKKGDDL